MMILLVWSAQIKMKEKRNDDPIQIPNGLIVRRFLTVMILTRQMVMNDDPIDTIRSRRKIILLLMNLVRYLLSDV